MQQVHMRLTWNRKSTGSRCWNEHGSFQTPLVVHWTKPLELNENVTARCVGQTGLGANIVSNVGGWNVCVAPTEQGWKWPMFITFLQVQTILLLHLSLRISIYIHTLDCSCRVFTSKNLLSCFFPPAYGSSASCCEKQDRRTGSFKQFP